MDRVPFLLFLRFAQLTFQQDGFHTRLGKADEPYHLYVQRYMGFDFPLAPECGVLLLNTDTPPLYSNLLQIAKCLSPNVYLFYLKEVDDGELDGVYIISQDIDTDKRKRVAQ